MCPGFTELAVGVWAREESGEELLTIQACPADQLTAQLCLVQCLQGKRIPVEAVRQLVEKSQKQSFPVGE